MNSLSTTYLMAITGILIQLWSASTRIHRSHWSH